MCSSAFARIASVISASTRVTPSHTVASSIWLFSPVRFTAMTLPPSRSLGPEFEPERHAAEFPPVILCPGPHVAGIHLHPEPGSLQVGFQFLCCCEHVVVPLPDRDRDNDCLDRCNGRRQDQPLVIAVHADEGGDAPLRDPVAGLVCQLLLPVLVLVVDRRRSSRSACRGGGPCRSGGSCRPA